MSDKTANQSALSASDEPKGDGSKLNQAAGSALSDIVSSILIWWREKVIGAVDQAAVIERRRDDCALSERYLFMTAMSAGIAVIGLLQSSIAVVIGAMLLSPLMGPIMGLGFALAIDDFRWLKQSTLSLLWGSVLAIALCALIVYFSPIQTITDEIAARTRPHLFDLLVALFSGMAGAYAMIRGRAGAIVGVAIATALMPPLAVVGFGLATANWEAFGGALLLYATNLITIALTALAMARLYGFRSSQSRQREGQGSGEEGADRDIQKQWQHWIVVAVFVVLAGFLTSQLFQIASEANTQRRISDAIKNEFVDGSEIDELEVNFRIVPIQVDAQVLTPNPLNEAEVESRLESRLAQEVGKEMMISLRQIRVSDAPSAAQREQLSQSDQRDREAAAALARAELLAARLALIAGVSEDEVTVDRNRGRANVRAEVLEGATMATYKALEDRIIGTERDWVIEVLPPLAQLPTEIEFSEDGPTPAGADALGVVEWASKRVNLPIVLIGPQEQAEQAAELLAQRGASVSVRPDFGPLRADWGGR